MILSDLKYLATSHNQAVIINVGTRQVTTLALLSALRHARMPVLLIDCESNDGSWDYFARLMADHPFDMLSAPLRQHGETLDWLFRTVDCANLLLVDSDLEILNGDIVRWMTRLIEQNHVFGSGFTHGPCWLHDNPGVGYYQERMWIPITLLKTACVRQALDDGKSFSASMIYNDFARPAFLSKCLASRFYFPRAKKWKLSWLGRLQNELLRPEALLRVLRHRRKRLPAFEIPERAPFRRIPGRGPDGRRDAFPRRHPRGSQSRRPHRDQHGGNHGRDPRPPPKRIRFRRGLQRYIVMHADTALGVGMTCRDEVSRLG